MKPYKLYLLTLLIFTALFMAGHVFAISRGFDVYGKGTSYFGTDNKLAFRSDGKFTKTAHVSSKNFNARIYMIGSSRLRDGLSPFTAAQLTGRSTFNYGVSGLVIKEMAPMVDHLLTYKKPELLIIGLDFFAFNDSTVPAKSMVLQDGIDFENRLKMYLSEFSARKALEMLDLKGDHKNLFCSRDGFCEDHRFTPEEVSQYISEGLTNTAGPTNPLHDFQSYDVSLALFESMLDRLKERGVKVVFYYPPAHILFYNALAEKGILDLHMQWQDKVTRTILAHGYNVWDFNIKSPGTNLPLAESHRFLNDDIHYNKDFGDIILRTLLTDKGDKKFSVKLTDKNLTKTIKAQEGLSRLRPEDY